MSTLRWAAVVLASANGSEANDVTGIGVAMLIGMDPAVLPLHDTH